MSFKICLKARHDLGLRMALVAAGLKYEEVERLLRKYWTLETSNEAASEIENIMAKEKESPAKEEHFVKIAIYLRVSLRRFLFCQGYEGDDLNYYVSEILWVAGDEEWDKGSGRRLRLVHSVPSPKPPKETQ